MVPGLTAWVPPLFVDKMTLLLLTFEPLRRCVVVLGLEGEGSTGVLPGVGTLGTLATRREKKLWGFAFFASGHLNQGQGGWSPMGGWAGPGKEPETAPSPFLASISSSTTPIANLGTISIFASDNTPNNHRPIFFSVRPGITAYFMIALGVHCAE